MTETTLTWILAAAVAQALFLGIALLTLSVRNRSAAISLGALLLLLAVLLGEELLDVAGAGPELAVGLAAEFGIAPTLYLFVVALCCADQPRTMPIAIHYVPLLLAVIVLLVLHQLNDAGNLGIAHPTLGSAVRVIVILKIVYFLVYGFFSLRQVQLSLAEAVRSDRRYIRWILYWLLGVLVSSLISYAGVVLQLFGLDAIGDSDSFSALIGAAIIFSISYFLLINQNLLNRRWKHDIEHTAQVNDDAARVLDYLTAESPYLDPDFTVLQLVDQLGLSSARISRAVELTLGTSFNEYANSLRLRAFEALVDDRQNSKRTTMDLAFAAGFPSKATFYRVFKAAKGVAPGDYRANQAANQSRDSN